MQDEQLTLKPFRLRIEIDVDAMDHQDAMEQGLDLLMQAPSVSVQVAAHADKEWKTLESNPDQAEAAYGASSGIVCQHELDPRTCAVCMGRII